MKANEMKMNGSSMKVLVWIACLAGSVCLLVGQERPERPRDGSTIREFDKDRDGRLSAEELDLVTKLPALRRTMGAFDADGDGRMDAGEAAAWYAAQTGSGDAGDAKGEWVFKRPEDLAVDREGNLLVADSGAHVIWRVGRDLKVTVLAGKVGESGAADGEGQGARFNSPGGVACGADGSLYVSDSGNGTVRRISPDGKVTTYAGKASTDGGMGKDGMSGDAVFRMPGRLDCDGAGNVYVTEPYGGGLRRISAEGKVTTLPDTVHGFAEANDVAVSVEGIIFVTDRKGGELVSIKGAVAKVIGKVPHGAVDTDDGGRAVVADLQDGKVFAVTGEGEYATLGPKGAGLPRVTDHCIAKGGDGEVYVLTRRGLHVMGKDGAVRVLMEAGGR